jgi:hypothetical protein
MKEKKYNEAFAVIKSKLKSPELITKEEKILWL